MFNQPGTVTATTRFIQLRLGHKSAFQQDFENKLLVNTHWGGMDTGGIQQLASQIHAQTDLGSRQKLESQRQRRIATDWPTLNRPPRNQHRASINQKSKPDPKQSCRNHLQIVGAQFFRKSPRIHEQY
ncbi:MAG: hypothetical protein EBR81_08790 [Proteobacteria bacterium]|nr:hypothetical protein [Pseudomonadota bacterium]